MLDKIGVKPYTAECEAVIGEGQYKWTTSGNNTNTPKPLITVGFLVFFIGLPQGTYFLMHNLLPLGKNLDKNLSKIYSYIFMIEVQTLTAGLKNDPKLTMTLILR